MVSPVGYERDDDVSRWSLYGIKAEVGEDSQIAFVMLSSR